MLRSFRVALLAFALLLTIDVLFFRVGFGWKLPYSTSAHVSHAAEKLRLINSLTQAPDIITLGTSWAEFAIDAPLIQEITHRRTENVGLISSTAWEQYVLFRKIKTRFPGGPKITVLMFDPTGLPITPKSAYKAYFESWPEVSVKTSGVEGVLAFVARRVVMLYRYRNDAEVLWLGLWWDFRNHFRGSLNNPYRDSGIVSARTQNIAVWTAERRWEKPFSAPITIKKEYSDADLDNFMTFANRFVEGGRTLVIAVPVWGAFPDTRVYEQIRDRIRDHPDLRVVDWRGQIEFQKEVHFYDFDHLNEKGAALYSRWLAEQLRGL